MVGRAPASMPSFDSIDYVLCSGILTSTNDVIIPGSNTVVAFIRGDNGVYSWRTENGGMGAFKSLLECVQHFMDVHKHENQLSQPL